LSPGSKTGLEALARPTIASALKKPVARLFAWSTLSAHLSRCFLKRKEARSFSCGYPPRQCGGFRPFKRTELSAYIVPKDDIAASCKQVRDQPNAETPLRQRFSLPRDTHWASCRTTSERHGRSLKSSDSRPLRRPTQYSCLRLARVPAPACTATRQALI
jgi:hypothetical protein